MITRRRLLAGIAIGGLAAPARGRAQPTKPARIGRLSPLSAEADDSNLAAFRQGLRELGWVEGQHFTIEARFADGAADRLASLAAELVVLRGANAPDVVPRHERRLEEEVAAQYGPGHRLEEVSEAWRPFRTWASVHLRALRERRSHDADLGTP